MSNWTVSSRTRRRLFFGLFAWIAGVAFALPLVWMVGSSFRTTRDIFANLSDITIFTLIPKEWTLQNYGTVLSGDFGVAVANSLFVTAVAVVAGLAVSAMAAFALAVLKFKGAAAVFAIIVLSFLVPFDAIAIPLADLFRQWHLSNSYVGLILPGVANGFTIFILRQFFLGIPWELTEAARVDGLGWWGIFYRIYLPLSRPALIGAGFTLFLFQWQSYLWPLLIGTTPEKTLGPIALANLSGQFRVDFGGIFAGSVVLTLVPMILLLFFQRYFAESLASTGSKN